MPRSLEAGVPEVQHSKRTNPKAVVNDCFTLPVVWGLAAAEREELQKQYLLQTQLMDRLQHEEVQGKVTVEMHLKELQQTKVIMKRGKWKDWRQNA